MHNKKDKLDEYLEFCREQFERMVREDDWLWTDSPNFKNLVDSEDNPKNV